MYIESKTYPVMDGEPHLGSITEHELIATVEEVREYICKQAEGTPELQDEYAFGTNPTVYITTTNYFDDDEIAIINKELA